MRAVALLLFFAAAFGVAALWQSHHVQALKDERELAARIQDGEVARSASGLIEAGWGVVVIGAPSGVEPLPGAESAATPQTSNAANLPQSAPPAPGDERLGDFELLVEPGQSLSMIARAHYGTAARDIVLALARYNGLADENALRAGQPLKLPPIDQLQR